MIDIQPFEPTDTNYEARGIATALKLWAIAFARQAGAQTIKTGNEENNPMYSLNLALGFGPTSAWLAFKKVDKQLTPDEVT